MGSVVRNDVTSRTPISDNPTSALTKHITAYVLLAGILGGLLLVLLVLCFCKMCFKPSKQLSRQPVLFVKYPSDKQGAGNRGSRKYKSLDPSVTIDLETSCGYSENSASPRDQDEVTNFPELTTRSQQPKNGEFPWFHEQAQAEVSHARFPDDEHPPVFSTEERSLIEDSAVSLTKYRRSPPFCRQTSFCIDSDEQLDQISPTASGDSILIIEMPKDNDKSTPQPDTRPQLCTVVIADSAAIQSTKISAEVHQMPEESCKRMPRDDEQELIGAVSGNGICVTVDEYMPCSSHPHVTLLDLDSPPDDTQAYYSGLRGPLVPPRVTLLRPSSPLAVVPESEAWEEEEGSSSCGNTKDENSLRRTTSTESGALEIILEERRRQLIRQDAGEDDDDMGEPRAKVRYNDTGSLEEVDDEVLDSYVDEDSDLSVEEVEAALLREQYRKLWRLRATFEEEIEESPPVIVLEQENTAPKEIVVTDDLTEATDADGIGTSPKDEEEEEEEEDEEEEEEEKPKIEPQLTVEIIPLEEQTEVKSEPKTEDTEIQQHLTITERRDNYKSILSKRLQKRKAPGLTPGSSADDSFDSVDTEGSSTDASRLEVATTSLDSTTDTTDSPGDGQASRLQQMKADSGYKSLETATSNGSVSGQKAPRLSRKQIHFVLNGSGSDSQLGATTGSSADRDEGVSEDFDASMEEIDPDKSKTTPVKAFPSLSRTPTQGSLTGDLESPSTEDVMAFTGGSKASVFTRFFRASPTTTTTHPERRHHPMLTRDFSVDEKSDALFREFSRLDPAYETTGMAAERARSPRLHPRSHRLHHRHTVDAGDGVMLTAPPRAGTRRKMSAQENIEEEIIRLERLRFPAPDTSAEMGVASSNVPVIQVAEEESGWKRD